MELASSNLYQVFCSLTDKELKGLDKAVHSEFFNYRQEEIRLFDYLYKAKKANRSLNAGDACKYVFTGKGANLAKLRHVMTYLARIINRYIIINEVEQAEEQKRLLLIQYLRRRNLSKQFLAQYNNAQNYFNNTAALSPDMYYQQLQLHTEFYSHSITTRKAQNEGLQKLSDGLDIFYTIQKLKYACNILSYKNIFTYGHEAGLMQEALTMIKRKKLLGNPLVKLFYYNYLCLSEPENETHFIQLKEALLTGSDKIDIKELKDIFTLAINYCIRNLNTGKQEYYHHLFDIYKAGLQKLVFEENGTLSPFTYKNIVAIGIGLAEYKWVQGFIEQYKDRLDKEIRAGFYAYCKARYYFALGKYDTVTQLLQEVEIKEQFTDLDTRVLLIKTYYEVDEADLLQYSLGNLKQQLKRKKMQTYHQDVYTNFARMMSQLSHLRPYDKKAKENLKQKVSTQKSIAEKEWLLSKIG